MGAFERGCKEGREYISRFPIQTMTLNGYRVMGRTSARRRYHLEKAQNAYLDGWVAVSGISTSLFQPDDADTIVVLAKIEVAQKVLEARRLDLEKVLSWREDDRTIHNSLQGAYRSIVDAQYYLNALESAVKEERGR